MLRRPKSGRMLVAPPTDVQRLCHRYVKRVNAVCIVREVLVVRAEEETRVWTMIDAPPFEDALREPIYQAQLQTLREFEGDALLDFLVLNVAELPEDHRLEHVVPPDAESLWRR